MDEQKRKITKAVAERIRHFRHINALSQETLALRADLNPAYLGQIERGLKCPTIDTLYRISSALHVPLSELLRFDEPQMDTADGRARLSQMLASVPEQKTEQVLKLIEDIVTLAIS